MEQDAYLYCVQYNMTCRSSIESSHSTVFNELTDMDYSTYSSLNE